MLCPPDDLASEDTCRHDWDRTASGKKRHSVAKPGSRMSELGRTGMRLRQPRFKAKRNLVSRVPEMGFRISILRMMGAGCDWPELNASCSGFGSRRVRIFTFIKPKNRKRI